MLHSCKCFSVRRLIAALVALLFPMSVWAACSPYLGTVVFNEVQIPNGSTPYIELRILDPTVMAATNNFASWNIDVYATSTGNLVNRSSLSSLFRSPDQAPPGSNACGQRSAWVQIPNPNIGNTIVRGTNLNYVLYDTSSGSPLIVDVLRMGNQSNLYTPGTSFASCPSIDPTLTSRYGMVWGSNGTKDWYRTPDGTGDWTGTLTSNNANSVCGDNNASSPGQLGLTKTASTSTVNTATPFNFTLYAQNPLNGTNASNVVVTDNLTTAGLTFVSCTATAPDTCTNSGNTVTWTISSLPVNSARSALLTVTAPSTGGTGLKTNTITANTTGTPTASASVTVSNTVPAVTTLAASSVAGTSAVLNGSVNPNGAATAVSLGYSAFAGSYTSTCTPATSSFSGSTLQNFSCTQSGLSCGTTYYFRATGTNSVGTSNGGELNFTTPSCGAVFDAYETSYTSTEAIAGTAKIKTHVASGTNLCVNGGACNLTIGAFNVGKTALQTSFVGPVKVEIVDASTGSCVNYALIATVSASLTLSSTGQTTVTLPAVPNSYPNARVRISFPASGAATAQNCSSDNFAIRPSGFVNVSAKDATSSTAGNVNTLNNKLLTTATPVHKTGRPFSLNAVSANVSGTTTTNYGGTPTVVLAQCSGGNAACIATPGMLTMGGSFASGVLASTTASYNDVGAFSMTLQDTTFAAVDASDSTTSERYISSTAVDVGRFVPDHFDTAVVTPGCSTFTYSGQPLTLFKVTAKDASGNTLTNYASSGVAQVVTLSDPNGVSGSFTSATIAASTFTAGVSNTSPTFTFTTKATAPASVRLRVLDSDAVSSSVGIDGTAATATEGIGTVRSGRIRMQNNYGSELLALPIITAFQYYQSTGWSTGTDTCTTLTPSNFAFSFPVDAKNLLAACETALSLMGANPTPTVILSKPGAGNTGWTNVTLSLGSTAVGLKCTVAGGLGGAETPANLDWLKFDWTGSGLASNPTAHAAFGKYKSSLIFRRENY